MISFIRIENLKNHTLSHGTYLYSPPRPPPPGVRTSLMLFAADFACERTPGEREKKKGIRRTPRPNRFALRILQFPSSPGACSQATADSTCPHPIYGILRPDTLQQLNNNRFQQTSCAFYFRYSICALNIKNRL